MLDDCITIALGLPEVGVVRQEKRDEETALEVAYRARSAPCPRWRLRTQGLFIIERFAFRASFLPSL